MGWVATILFFVEMAEERIKALEDAFTKLSADHQQLQAEASGQVDPEDADMSEGEILGAPSDSAVAFRKAAQRRMNKGYRFLSHPGTPGTLLVWMVISDIVMPIHYRLFKYATFFTLQGRTVWDVRILWRRQWPSQPCRQGSR